MFLRYLFFVLVSFVNYVYVSELPYVNEIADYLVKNKELQFDLNFDTYAIALKEIILIDQERKDFKNKWFPKDDGKNSTSTSESNSYDRAIKKVYNKRKLIEIETKNEKINDKSLLNKDNHEEKN